MIKAIREVSQSIYGSAEKIPSKTELDNIKAVRKSLCYASKFKRGKKLKEDDFIALRPEQGINPMQIDTFIGKKLTHSVNQQQKVNLNHFI